MKVRYTVLRDTEVDRALSGAGTGGIRKQDGSESVGDIEKEGQRSPAGAAFPKDENKMKTVWHIICRGHWRRGYHAEVTGEGRTCMPCCHAMYLTQFEAMLAQCRVKHSRPRHVPHEVRTNSCLVSRVCQKQRLSHYHANWAPERSLHASKYIRGRAADRTKHPAIIGIPLKTANAHLLTF